MLNHLGLVYFILFYFIFSFFFLRLGLGQRRAVVIIGRWLLPSLVDTGDICCHYWQHILVEIRIKIKSPREQWVNSLAAGGFHFNFRLVIFKLTLVNGGLGISHEISLRWMPLDLTGDKSTLVQVMAWCRQATSHYLSQCWPRSLSPYGVTRPQWVNDKILLRVCSQYNGYWCPGDTWTQGICWHDSDLLCWDFVGPKFQDVVPLKFQMSWKLTNSRTFLHIFI